MAMLSLASLAARIDHGELTPADALHLQRDAIAAREDEIGAFATLDQAAPAESRGPLRGIAVGLKDIIETADMPTELGSPIYAGWRPKADAPVVAALKRAGATIIGKTTTTPFAFMDPTATRNPHNLAHTPGGSSAGSAAAVGAGMIPLALGTQTGGSVIRPASFNGVAAIKPSFRVLPTVGVKCGSWTLDTLGLFAASVSDLALALSAMTGRKVDAAAPQGLRLAVMPQAYAGPRDPESDAALEKAARAAESAGARLIREAEPGEFAHAWEAQSIIQDFETRVSLSWEYDHHRDMLPPFLRTHIEAAASIPIEEYDEARRKAHRARGVLGNLFKGFDAILTLSAPGPAPSGYASTGASTFNRLWTLMGNPCVNVPGHWSAAGLPVGVQVIAPYGRDASALAAARFVEASLARAA
jgi:Asp-tRNA(Asn)/Glu-tRNA(Gln) amidotransferase A subunit family amidase